MFNGCNEDMKKENYLRSGNKLILVMMIILTKSFYLHLPALYDGFFLIALPVEKFPVIVKWWTNYRIEPTMSYAQNTSLSNGQFQNASAGKHVKYEHCQHHCQDCKGRSFHKRRWVINSKLFPGLIE